MGRDTDARRAAAHALFGVDTQAARVTADRIIDAYLAALVPNDGAAILFPDGTTAALVDDSDTVAAWIEPRLYAGQGMTLGERVQELVALARVVAE